MAQALADQGNAAADHKANLRRLEEIKESLRVVKTSDSTYFRRAILAVLLAVPAVPLRESRRIVAFPHLVWTSCGQ